MADERAIAEAGRLGAALIAALPDLVDVEFEAGREEPHHPWPGAGSLSWNAVTRLRNLALRAEKALNEGKFVHFIPQTVQPYNRD